MGSTFFIDVEIHGTVGWTWTFRKLVDGVGLSFSVHWLDEMQVYWWGQMTSFFNYYPSDNYLHPILNLEIDSITKRFMVKDAFDGFEQRLVNGVKSQTIL